MRTSRDIYDHVEAIANTRGKNDKIHLIGKLEYNDLWREVLVATYDPLTTYGVKKLPEPDTPGGNVFLKRDEAAGCEVSKAVYDLLDGLAAREITGNNAQTRIKEVFELLEPASAKLLERILKKDLRMGATASSINKAIPGLVYNFECMLAHKYEPKRIKEWPVAVEPKMDGYRLLAFVKRDGVRFFTRSGLEYTSLSHLTDPLREACQSVMIGEFDEGVVLDGEVLSGDHFNDTGSVRRKNQTDESAKFYIFDIYPMRAWNEERDFLWEYPTRREWVEKIGNADTSGMIKLLPSDLAHSHEEIMAIYGAIREKKGEGVIVKPLDGKYERKRSHKWLKIKAEETEDLIITGVYEGEAGKKYEGQMGGAYVDRAGVSVGVGGGWSDEQRKEYWEAPDKIVGRMIEVEYHEVTPDGSLRHPRFVRFRDDKFLS